MDGEEEGLRLDQPPSISGTNPPHLTSLLLELEEIREAIREINTTLTHILEVIEKDEID